MTQAYRFLSDINRTWHFVLSHRKDIAMISVIDLIFFLCFAAAHYFIIRMLPYLREVNEIIAQNAGALNPSSGPVAIPFPVAAFQGVFRAILANLFLFVLSVFVAWCVVEGYAWYRTHVLLGKKIHAGTYLVRFSLLSAVWIVLVAVVSLVALRATTFFAVASLSGVPAWAGPAFVGILAFLVSYVVIMGYLLCAEYPIPKMPLWKTMKKKTGVFLSSAILIAASLLLTGFLGRAIEIIAPLGIVFLVIPSAVFARVLLIKN